MKMMLIKGKRNKRQRDRSIYIDEKRNRQIDILIKIEIKPEIHWVSIE